LVLGQSFPGHHQPASGAVERIVLAAPMAEGLVLHPASALIERGVGELHDVEQG
jgi:hypothetical protein